MSCNSLCKCGLFESDPQQSFLFLCVCVCVCYLKLYSPSLRDAKAGTEAEFSKNTVY